MTLLASRRHVNASLATLRENLTDDFISTVLLASDHLYSLFPEEHHIPNMAKRDSKGKGAKEPENDNFARLCALLIDEGTKVLKDIFDKLNPADQLQQLLEVPVIHAALKKFYPAICTHGLRFHKNSSEFNIALLWLLISIAKTLPHRSLSLISETDSALTRMNVHRQDLYARIEKSKRNITNDEFERLWNEIEDMLSDFESRQGREAEISKMKDEPISRNRKRRYTKLLEKWSQCEDYLKKHQAAQKQVDETNETEAKGHDDGKQGPSSTTKNVETQKQIERLAQVIEEMRSKVEALRLTSGEEVEISQRRTACKNIDRDVKILQSELEALRISTDDEIIDVLEGKVKDLSDENKKLKVELKSTKVTLLQLTTEHELLKKDSEETKVTLHQLTESHNSLIEDMKEMKAFKKELEIEREILNFAQFCWNIEGLMVKYVFSSLCEDYTCYRLQDIKEEIARLEKEGTQEDSKKATKNFEELKKKLYWDSAVYEKAMNRARKYRNNLAHPDMMLAEDVEKCINVLNENGMLEKWKMTREQAGTLKDIWEELRSMDY